MSNQSRSNYITIDGLRLHYIESGDHNARPMIVLHGIGDNAHIWDYFTSDSSRLFRTFALDQRGHGDSEWARPPAYGCEDYVNDLDDFVKALQLKDILLIGHSMGALHADKFAALKPEKVAALIHVDIEPCPPGWNKRYLTNLYYTLPNYYESLDDFVCEIQETSPFGEKEMLFRLASLSLHKGEDGKFRTKFDKEALYCFDQYDLTPHLRSIKCPTLIIRGKESRVMRREQAEQMAQMLLDCQLEEIQLATHRVQTDNPSGFQAAIFKFLERARLIC